jgi:hypothetical protein
MKKILIIVGAVLLVAAVAAGSFWGGMAYKSKQLDQTRASFMQARGIQDQRQFPGGNPPAGDQPQAGGPGFLRGGTTGVVKTIDGNVMTISTAEDVTTVNLSADTPIQKSAQAALADIQPGMRVTVTGQLDSDGNIKAIQIMILNTDPSGVSN